MNEQESAQLLGDIELLGEGLALASAQTPTHARLYQRVFERIRERAAQLVNGETAMQKALAEAKTTIEQLLNANKEAASALELAKATGDLMAEELAKPEPEPVAAENKSE